MPSGDTSSELGAPPFRLIWSVNFPLFTSQKWIRCGTGIESIRPTPFPNTNVFPEFANVIPATLLVFGATI